MAVAEQSTIDSNRHRHLSSSLNIKSTLEENKPGISVSINDKRKCSVNKNIDYEGKTNIVRKGLGCRRSLKDMLSPEEQQAIKIGDNMGQGVCFGRKQLSRELSRSLRELKPQQRLIFTSPRVISSDEDLFPSNHSLYKESSDRWQQISNQAGIHRQDGTVMNIGLRPSNAMAFRMGMIGCAAVRVRSLNLWLDHEKDTLPDWLKMIAEIFSNLEHLTLTEDVFPGEDEMAVSARMRRLYVLSILPNLKSIDEMVVTPKERKMANPGGSRLDRDDLQSLSSESIRRIGNQDIDSMTVSIPVSIDTDSVGSSRGNGIEVEFLATKFWDVNQTQTETTANSSPTTNSETTITADELDDQFAFEEEDILVEAAFLNDTIADSSLLSINRKLNSSHGEKNRTDTKTLEQIISASEKDADLTHRCDNASTRSIMHHHQNTVYKKLSKEDNVHANDDLRNKVASTRVRAFHSDSNNSIELVSVASTDLECSAACHFLNVREKITCNPTIRLPFSSEDMNTPIEAPSTLTQVSQDSTTIVWTKGSKNENSNQEACTPVQRQSKVIVSTPHVGCCQILRNDPCTASKFSFPTANRRCSKTKPLSHDKLSDLGVSANQQFPPSKSLSSPFPMQFRERRKPSCITTTTNLVSKTSDSINCDFRRVQPERDCLIQNEIEIVASRLSVITSSISSPKSMMSKTVQKGELPPPCPSENIRRKVRKSRNRNQRKLNYVLKESARSTSVMDLDDEEEFFDNCIGDE